MKYFRFITVFAVLFLPGNPAWPLTPTGEAEELVEVDVQVVEVNKSKMTKAGLDWARMLEGASPVLQAREAGGTLSRVGTFSRGQLDAFVHALEADNYGKLLAKPKLLTVSGSPANFMVGGELPVVTQDSQGHTSVSWKEYGVKLYIKPERKKNAIRTAVRAESSTVDPTTAVSLGNGTYIPGVRTRWAETTLELAPRATVIIAGLIQTEDAKITSGFPVLSGLPLLGWLFRTTRIERNETELVIFVTPSLVSAQAGSSAP